MRVRTRKSGVSVQAIAGTHVVLLGLDVTKNKRKGLLGFALHREDHTENEAYWLKGFRTFEATDPTPAPGALVSTLEHPIQAFSWGDYTAKPNHKYTYTAVPMYGKPKNLKEGLVLHYSFDRNRVGRIPDKSGRGNDGLVSGTTWIGRRITTWRGDAIYIGVVTEGADSRCRQSRLVADQVAVSKTG